MTFGTPQKKCHTCKIVKPSFEFEVTESGELLPTCRACHRPTEKRCARCKIVKPIGEFNKAYNTPDLHNSCCRVCANAQARERTKANRVAGPRRRPERSAQLAETRAAAMAAQERDPDADYHANYKGVVGPIIFGCIADASVRRNARVA